MFGTHLARRAHSACWTCLLLLVAWPVAASAQRASVHAPAKPAAAEHVPADLSRWAPLLTRGVGGQLLAAQAAPARPAPQGSACTCHACASEGCDCGCAEDAAHDLPPGFYDQLVLDGLDQVTGFTFGPGGLVYLWEKAGRVRIMEPDGTLDETPFVDITEEVGNWGDHGLLSVALDPQFASNGFIYLLYAVDHYYAKWFGTAGYDPLLSDPNIDTIGRLTRYTADPATGLRTALPGSRVILLGESITTGIPIESTTHGVGTVRFGEDGNLLVSCGDGAAGPSSGTALADGIYKTKENIGNFRAQLVDSFSGKILRLDPSTGDGVPDNPFFDPADPRAPRSRVWMLGLRQPCRFVVQPGSGSGQPPTPGRLAVADVGAEVVEEVSVAEAAGTNFGWPIYEGLGAGLSAGTLKKNLDAPNPLAGPACHFPFFLFQHLLVQDSLNPPAWPNPCDATQAITTAPTFVHHRPALDWLHDGGIARVPTYDASGAATFVQLGAPDCPAAGETFGGNCSIAGAWYPGGSFPDEYDGALFQMDYGQGWMRVLRFDSQDRLVSVEPFADMVGKPVWAEVNPADGSLWYLDYTLAGVGNLRALRYSTDNIPPTAVATAAPAYGPSPVEAVFDSTGSADPEGLPIDTRWTFSDGSPYSVFAHTTRSLPAEDITAQGTIVAYVLELDPPGSTGFSNHDIELIRDGVRPPLDTLDDQLQYDTIHVPASGVPDKGGLDWYGYTFAEPRTFTGLLFQEGINYNGGGWFDSLHVQVRNGTTWTDVPGWTSDPPYPSSLVHHFETFEIRFPDAVGDGIRLEGVPGGISPLQFTTVAELRVVARPLGPPAATHVDATLTVTDAVGATALASVSVVLDDTPPHLVIHQPHTGDVYSTAGPTPVDCLASLHDLETGAESLQCTWQVILHHNTHTHPQPLLEGCTPSTFLIPEGLCNGDLYFQEVRCTVTDPSGLTATASVWIVPDCDKNLNTLPDDQDIASGTSRDHDHDGVPDEVQSDCNGNGVGDFYDIYFGTSVDEDHDGVPDDCAAGATIQTGHLPGKGPPQQLK